MTAPILDPLVQAFLRGHDRLAAVVAAPGRERDPAWRLARRILAWPSIARGDGALRQMGPEPDPALVRETLAEVRAGRLPADQRAVLIYLILAGTRPSQLPDPEYLAAFRDLANASFASEVPILANLPSIAALHSTHRHQLSGALSSKRQDSQRLIRDPLSYRSLFMAGLAGIAEPALSQLAELGTDTISKPIDQLQAQLFNAIMAGATDQAISLLETVSFGAPGNRRMANALLPVVWLMHAMQNGIPISTDGIRQQMVRAGIPDQDLFHQDITELLLLPFSDADDLRQILDHPHVGHLILSVTSAIAFNPIRAATLLGDIDRAGDMLQQRSRAFIDTYLDHLFWMRLHLLDRDEAKAADHLHMLLAGARHHRCLGRVEFELRLAREMPMTRFAALSARRAPAMIALGSPSLPDGRDTAPQVIGSSAAIAKVKELVVTYADHLLPVLICGETGTGKDLIARALHARSTNRQHPYVAVNCGSINDSLLEAELFGHIKGSYTGAMGNRSGLIAAAGDGTLFLDEIGDTTPRFQVALLRLLENRSYRPIGSDDERPMRCRILAASNVDLQDAVARGAFREDLFYRLHRLQITIPPLRDRAEDIPALAEHFLNEDGDGMVRHLDPDLARFLREERWPGNIRQLRNEMELLRIHLPMRRTLAVTDYLSLPHRRPDHRPLPSARQVASEERRSPPLQDQPGPTPLSDPPPRGIGNPRMERLERLRDLFRHHHRLTRKEVGALLGVSHVTATTYLRELIAEGLITKVMPNAGPASHYFEMLA